MRDWPGIGFGVNAPRENQGGFYDATYEQLEKIFWLLYDLDIPDWVVMRIEDWINGYDSFYKENFPTGTDWFINWLEGNYYTT